MEPSPIITLTHLAAAARMCYSLTGTLAQQPIWYWWWVIHSIPPRLSDTVGVREGWGIHIFPDSPGV